MARRHRKKGGFSEFVPGVVFIVVAIFIFGDTPSFKAFTPILLLLLFLLAVMFIIKLIIKSVGSSRYNISRPEPYSYKASEPVTTETDLYPVWRDSQVVSNKPVTPESWSLKVLSELEWKRFEEVTAEYYRIQGFDAKTTRIGADGGIDIVLRKDGLESPIAVVQCKAHKNNIGVKAIRELFGVMADQNVKNGVFITTSNYTNEARQFAQKNQMQLLSGEDFIKKINSLDHEQKLALLKLATRGDYSTPTCPRCDVKMILKTRHKDNGKFWACPNYRPFGKGCSQTINVRQ